VKYLVNCLLKKNVANVLVCLHSQEAGPKWREAIKKKLLMKTIIQISHHLLAKRSFASLIIVIINQRLMRE
jgi:hypothetical protein